MGYDNISQEAVSYAQNLVYKKGFGHRLAYLKTDNAYGYTTGSTAHFFALKAAKTNKKKAEINKIQKEIDLGKKLAPVYEKFKDLSERQCFPKDEAICMAAKLSSIRNTKSLRDFIEKKILEENERKRMFPHLYSADNKKKVKEYPDGLF